MKISCLSAGPDTRPPGVRGCGCVVRGLLYASSIYGDRVAVLTLGAEGSVLMVREIRLNVLPAELDVGSGPGKVCRLERRSAGEEKLRGLGEEARQAFRIYSHAGFTYVWPRRGRLLPEALQEVETEQVLITDLPAAVTAFAVREAIADHLLLAGFERLPSSLVRPARLFRRRKNLAHEALGGELQDNTGIFPTAMVQGMCLAQDEAKPDRSAWCWMSGC